MKRVIVAVLIAGMSLYISSCSKEGGDSATDVAHMKGVVTFLMGEVSLQRGADTASVTLGDTVSRGDILITGADGSVIVQIGERGVIRLQGNSELEFQQLFGNDEGKFYLKSGEVLSKVSKLQKGESYRVVTQTVVASVRGTEFSTSYRQGGGTVAVRRGKIALTPSKPEDLKPDTVAEVVAEDGAVDGEATILEEGKTADIVTATPESDSTATVEPEITVRDIAASEELTIEKVSTAPVIEMIDQKKPEDLQMIQEPIKSKDQELDKKIETEKQRERVTALINKPSKTIEEIREVFSRIDEITLYNGRTVRGAIVSRGAQYTVVTTGATIRIAEKDIKNVRVVR